MKLIVTCEHAGNKIPTKYKARFVRQNKILHSHQGYDIGILPIAKQFGKQASFFLYNETSRLLVDFNRSEHHRNLFSPISKQLSQEEKQAVLEQYYDPYRQKILDAIARYVLTDKVLHISCHSFTPKLGQKIRRADVGLLYDSRNQAEREFCVLWQHNLEMMDGRLNVRRNYPYRGNADGLTTFLRGIFPPNQYLGVELEVSQNLLIGNRQKRLAQILRQSLALSLKQYSK